jgi:hypothetical protein
MRKQLPFHTFKGARNRRDRDTEDDTRKERAETAGADGRSLACAGSSFIQLHQLLLKERNLCAQ